MFLKNLMSDNKDLIKQAVKLYQDGKINPDSFVLDYQTIISNASKILSEANKKNIELFCMCKQIGRNPYIVKELINIGYTGIVAVDFKEALFYMKLGLPIKNVGYISQIPDSKLPEIIKYGVEYITIYSIEKLEIINNIAKSLGVKQKIMLHVYDKNDVIYKNQEGGILLDDLDFILKKEALLTNIIIAGVTSFPCFLCDKNELKVTNNLKTLQKSKTRIGDFIKIDAPSNNNVWLIKKIKKGFVDIMEPGHSLTGTTPFNIEHYGNELYEKIGYLYITEVSHVHENISLCFGGGSYFNSYLENALVIDGSNIAITKVITKKFDSIDYYIRIKGKFNPGSIVILAFRAQMFITRSDICVLDTKVCELYGTYDGRGNKI